MEVGHLHIHPGGQGVVRIVNTGEREGVPNGQSPPLWRQDPHWSPMQAGRREGTGKVPNARRGKRLRRASR
jgi:hypothetical protein